MEYLMSVFECTMCKEVVKDNVFSLRNLTYNWWDFNIQF